MKFDRIDGSDLIGGFPQGVGVKRGEIMGPDENLRRFLHLCDVQGIGALVGMMS